MAETPVPITPGSGGASIAGDLANGKTYQQIKLVDGTIGSENALIVNSDGTANVRVSGSVAVSITPTANQSVSGTVGASVIGIVPVQLSNSSIITVPQISSVIAVPTGNQSVSGTMGASVIGWVPIQPSNTSTIGIIQSSVATVIIGGSIAASFTPPANQSVSGTVQTDVRGSVAVAIISGSIAASFTPPANQSVSGTVQTDVRGSVAVAIISGSIAATFTPPANQSVSGTVGASIIGQLPAGTAVLGSVAALQGTNPWNIAGSVAAFAVGNASIITVLQSSSLIAVNAGSVIAIPSGSVITVLQAPSIVGTYAEDSASANADKGIFTLNVRNDTLSSVTSNDGDYGALSIGPAGEGIFANAPITKWISGTASMLGGTPVTGSLVPIIAAQGASVFTYITGLQVVNASATNAWITLLGATNSVVGFTVAPANGGSNVNYPNGLKTNANAIFSASISAVASVYVSAQGFISKT